MTELNEKNKKIYLDLCKNVWDFDDESMEYVSKRLSDEWEPVPELKSLINSKDAVYEDQRIRFNIDMKNPTVQSFFINEDNSYRIFKSAFQRALSTLRSTYNCDISYSNFIENKVIFKKNTTKIKKVLETVYAENESAFERDASRTYSKEECSRYIVKKFEEIGTSKKSSKNIQFVISFNPIDWLLSSTAEEFSSCFNLNNTESGGYQYCLGLPFLCGDKNRMMLYITNGKTKEFMGIKVDSVQTRTWCILDKSGTYNIVKWYPNDTVGVSPVTSITGNGNFQNRDSFREGKYAIDVLSTKKGLFAGVYSDMGRLVEANNELHLKGNGKDGQQIFTKNLVCCSDGRKSTLYFGDGPQVRASGISPKRFRIPDWKKFGLHLDMLIETPKCSCCGDDKLSFLVNSKEFYCYDCYKKSVAKCKCCGVEYMKKPGVSNIVVDLESNEKIELCDRCYSQIEDRTCSCCGKYSSNYSLDRTADGKRICKNCLASEANGYIKCDGCGEISNNGKNLKYFNTFTRRVKALCDDCKNSNSEFEDVSTFGRYFRVLKQGRTLGTMPIE